MEDFNGDLIYITQGCCVATWVVGYLCDMCYQTIRKQHYKILKQKY
jgi:hypothetical protein